MAKKKKTALKLTAQKKTVAKKKSNSNGAVKKNKKTTAKKTKGQPKKKIAKITLPVEYVFADNIAPTFTNSFVVRHEKGMFHFFFFHTRGPMVMTDDPVEQKKQYEQLDSVKSECLGHFVVTTPHAKEIIDALVINFDKFKQSLPEEV